jgi:dihydrofolate synthase / folylpolyglutamate synthase
LDYPEALAWLAEHYNLEAQRVTAATAPDLSRIADLMHVMADPQRSAPFVHVTGTNGKGSTTRMTTALLSATGLGVGGYVSPHIDRVNERITLGNEPLDDDEFALAVSLVASVEPFVVERVGSRPSYFEALVGAAYAWFADAGLDAAVVEVGVGGRFDATNVGDGQVAVVTNIGHDHVEWIGPGLTDIAREKAGIIKPGSHLVLGETDPELAAIFTAEPAETVWRRGPDFDCAASRLAVGGRALDLRTPTSSYEDAFLPLHGAHQADNAAVALAAAEAFVGAPLGDDLVRDAFASVTAPGRFEVMGRRPLTIVDGAHNADGAVAVAATLANDFSTDGPVILVVGCNAPRDPVELLEPLSAVGPSLVVCTAADWTKARPPAEVAAAAAALGLAAEPVTGVAAAVDVARRRAGADGTVLVTGSLYVVGEARRAILSGNRPES